MATLNISLSNEMRAWIDVQIATGTYTNASDYMRDLIRHDQQHREHLRLALIEAEQSGTSPHTVKDIIAAAKSTLNHHVPL